MNEPAFTWTDERVELLKALWDLQWSSSRIADRLGAPTRNTVLGKIFRLGLSRPRPPPKPRVKRVRVRVRKPAANQPAEKRAPAATPAPARPCSLLEFTDETCRYPISDDGPPYVFCGALEADMSNGRPYCLMHARIAYRRPGEREAA